MARPGLPGKTAILRETTMSLQAGAMIRAPGGLSDSPGTIEPPQAKCDPQIEGRGA
ncbi:hypothetical protein SAMN02745121_04771 [Nannocystis exedens]|uniref:Uncharacterized protein n=1 Tax=Nannocystis exedens TaxID=54 RepID=A0A1I2BT98_9BACT|nr:hypothetical protein NAEX_04341 [Nannocystis exedens]SFE59312.1 hypothetical protein SAMN02745121_04771 [Nannocystis exedens]